MSFLYQLQNGDENIGIPTKTMMPNEKYLAQFKFYVSGFETSPFGIEWMRFEADSPMPKLIQSVSHLAFVVPDLDYELANRGFKILTYPNAPMNGVRVAMIENDGTPIELMEFDENR
jgi:hypothetical protein